jgi:hypothetical protein
MAFAEAGLVANSPRPVNTTRRMRVLRNVVALGQAQELDHRGTR